MAYVQINTEEVREKANAYNRQGEQLGESIQEMKSLMDVMREGFKGKTSDALNEIFQEMIPSLGKAEQMIAEFASTLNKAADEFDNL